MGLSRLYFTRSPHHSSFVYTFGGLLVGDGGSSVTTPGSRLQLKTGTGP